MNWYKREIKKYSVDMNTKIIAGVIITVFFSLWYYFTNGYYQWEEINIIPFVPWIGGLISALTYLTIGKLFYKSKVIYIPLSFIFVTLLDDKQTYNKIKRIIWIFLGLFMYFFVLPIAVSILNMIISVIYNSTLFLLYTTPAIAISGILILGLIFLKNK